MLLCTSQSARALPTTLINDNVQCSVFTNTCLYQAMKYKEVQDNPYTPIVCPSNFIFFNLKFIVFDLSDAALHSVCLYFITKLSACCTYIITVHLIYILCCNLQSFLKVQTYQRVSSLLPLWELEERVFLFFWNSSICSVVVM